MSGREFTFSALSDYHLPRIAYDLFDFGSELSAWGCNAG